MKTLLRVLAFLASVALLVASLPAWALAAFALNTDPAYRLNERQERLAAGASRYVSGFRAHHGRLPLQHEFQEWVATQPEAFPSYAGWGFSYEHGPFRPEVQAKFGMPPEDGYVITFWEGDATVMQASWSRLSFITDDDAYLFGNRLKDVAIFMGVALGLSASALALLVAAWRGRLPFLRPSPPSS